MAQNEQLFRRIDLMIEKIHQYAVEPLFSENVLQRSNTEPNFAWSDDYILKEMIELIAFSQQVRSELIRELFESGVFNRVFSSYSPSYVANLDHEELRKLYWDNPSRPRERLSYLRFPSKLEKMVTCAKRVIDIASRHGSFMRFLELQRFPLRIRSNHDADVFWEAFDKTLNYFKRVNMPFFNNFTSLCHLLQVLGYDCAKPDSVVMGTASRLTIVRATGKHYSDHEKHKVIRTMQLYSAHKGIRTPVVDLYFLIDGGQTETRKKVRPDYYS